MVFEKSCHCETSAHTGRGNPPVSGEMYRKAPGNTGVATIFGGNRYPIPFNRGIATPVCGLVRNDSIFNRGIATPVCALARNDSVYSTNINLSYGLDDETPALETRAGVGVT